MLLDKRPHSIKSPQIVTLVQEPPPATAMSLSQSETSLGSVPSWGPVFDLRNGDRQGQIDGRHLCCSVTAPSIDYGESTTRPL